MAAVVLLAAAILSIATVLADRAPRSDAATTATTSVATSSNAASSTAIASSWTMEPLPEPPVYTARAPIISATSIEPVTKSSSVVEAPR